MNQIGGEDANPVQPAFIAEDDEFEWELEVNGGRWLDINGQLMWLLWNIIEGDAGYSSFNTILSLGH